MITLKLNREPTWLNMPCGVRLLVAPFTTQTLLSAQFNVADGDQVDEQRAALALVCAIARDVILDWDGVVDDDGNPCEMTEHAIVELMRQCFPVFLAFQQSYVNPAIGLLSEGND